MYFEKRNIAVCIILSIVTCGIYSIYWYYVVARDFYNHQTPNRVDMSPGLVVLLDIVTCGIYGIYVYYKWGKQTPEVAAMYGRYGEDRSILYLIMPFLGLSIVNMALIQSDFNDLADAGAPMYPPTPQQPGSYPPPAGGTYPPGGYSYPQGMAPDAYTQQPQQPGAPVPPPPPPAPGMQPDGYQQAPPAPTPPQPEAPAQPAPPEQPAPPVQPAPPAGGYQYQPPEPPAPPPGSPYSPNPGANPENDEGQDGQ